jgi:hypothetical protein
VCSDSDNDSVGDSDGNSGSRGGSEGERFYLSSGHHTALHYTTSHTAHHTPDHSSSYSQIRSSFLLIIHTLTIYPIPVPSSLGSVDMITAAMVFHHVTHAKAGKCVSAHRSAEETAVCVKL